MTNLGRPDFSLVDWAGVARPVPTREITPAEWWLWLHLQALERKTKLGGILARKSGYHAPGSYNLKHFPKNYSIRDAPDRTGPWWKDFASALDWTFPTAQAGDFALIDRYTSRLLKSAQDAKDPRLDMVLVEFYGQADNDRAVEGWDERDEHAATSDSSHLWHIHMSFIRSECGDFWGMWALLTVLMGWSVAAWRASLPAAPKPPVVKPKPTPAGLPKVTLGSRTLELKSPQMKGTDVVLLQKWVGAPADGIFGPATKEKVKRYQGIRGLTRDGIAGPKTLGPIVKALAD
jgi:peptidoglycan hydrolase-like protein with peptidoglycan-binding domain